MRVFFSEENLASFIHNIFLDLSGIGYALKWSGVARDLEDASSHFLAAWDWTTHYYYFCSRDCKRDCCLYPRLQGTQQLKKVKTLHEGAGLTLPPSNMNGV